MDTFGGAAIQSPRLFPGLTQAKLEPPPSTSYGPLAVLYLDSLGAVVTFVEMHLVSAHCVALHTMLGSFVGPSRRSPESSTKPRFLSEARMELIELNGSPEAATSS